MEWSWLLVLICPLMMLFMMKGMHGNHSKHEEQKSTEINALKKHNLELNQQLDEVKMESKPLNKLS